MNNPRDLALQTLTFFDKNGYVPFRKVEIALSTLSVVDRSFCTNLIFQTLRKRILIDKILKEYLTRPDKIPLGILKTLRIGVTQLFFMDSIPDYAAINSTVELVGVKSFKGLVNAVLRRLMREHSRDDIEQDPGSTHPKWLIEEFLKIPGISPEELNSLLEYNQRQPDETFEFIGDQTALAENGYVYTISDYSPLLVLIEKGKPIDGLTRVDETRWLINKCYPELPVFEPQTTHTGKIDEKPWLLLTLTPERVLKMGRKIIEEMLPKLAKVDEFIFLSDSIMLAETSGIIEKLVEFTPISINNFIVISGLKGKSDAFGTWFLPPGAPQPVYITRLRRRKNGN